MNRRQTLAALALSSSAQAQPSARDRFIGTWKLRSCLRTFTGGRTEYPFGQQPVGRLQYDPSGRMSAIAMRPGRKSPGPGVELDQAPCEILRDSVAGFVAYFGTFEIDETGQSVVHHVQASLQPSAVGTVLRRRFRFESGRLVLLRQGAGSSDELVWERDPA